MRAPSRTSKAAMGSPVPLFGRDALLARIDALLASPRACIQLLGPPGVGRSAVLQACAQRHRAPLLDLRSTKSRRQAASALHRLEAHPFVCIDHPESVRTAVVSWLRDFAGRCVVASRERLDVEAATLLDVPPLATEPDGNALSPAVALFVDRARRARPDLVLDAAQLVAVDALVRAVDGVPLAIETLASRVRVARPADLYDPIDGPFDLLAADRTSRSLWLALEESWRALDGASRRTLALCAWFEAPFEHAVVHDILERVGPQRDRSVTLGELEHLVDVGLLAVSPESSGAARFRMWNVVRASVRSQRAARDTARSHAAAIVTQYRDASRAALASCVGAHADESFAWLARELPHLRRAIDQAAWVPFDPRDRAQSLLELALAIDAVGSACEPARNVRPALDAAIDAARGACPEDGRLARALLARAETHLADGAFRDAERDVECAETVLRADPSLDQESAVAAARGRCHWFRGEIDEAIAWFSRAFDAARAAGSGSAIARAATALGYAVQLAGRLDDAENLFATALAEAQRAADPAAEDAARLHRASLSLDRGEERLAVEQLHALRTRFEARGDRRRLAVVLGDLGFALLARGAADEARAMFESCLATTVALELRPTVSLVRAYVGCCLEECGEIEMARRLYTDAIEEARRSGNRIAEGLALAWSGRLEAQRGEVVAAQHALDRATECFELVNDRVRWEVAYLCRGHLELALAAEAESAGRRDEALALRHHARERAASARPALGVDAAAAEGRASFAGRSADVRQSLRMLEAALPTDPLPSIPPPAMRSNDSPSDALVIATDASWFRAPHAAATHLRTRRSLRLVLALLARQRRDAPGVAADVETLFAAGWPGERALSPSRASRVYVALSTLRGLGLREILIRRDDGYLLDATVPVVEG